jgi:hypothetical protein
MAYNNWVKLFVYIFHQWHKIVGLGCLYKLFNNVTWTFGLRFRNVGLGFKAFALRLRAFVLKPRTLDLGSKTFGLRLKTFHFKV